MSLLGNDCTHVMTSLWSTCHLKTAFHVSFTYVYAFSVYDVTNAHCRHSHVRSGTAGLNMAARCELACVSKRHNAYYNFGSALDGTPCGEKTADQQKLCAAGVCLVSELMFTSRSCCPGL